MLGCMVAGSLVPSGSAAKRAMDALNVSDKLWHFMAYSVLMLLPALHERRLATALQAVGIVSLGLALEFGQRLFAGRSFDSGDVAANVAGVLVGLLAGAWLRLTGHLTMKGEGA
jgi:VanZ family protein